MGFEEQEGVYDTRIEAEETVAECEGKADPIFHELNGVEGLQVEDILQMEFCTPEEARCFYNSYSRLKGFATRQGKKVPNKVGEIVRYTFVCNRQGFRDKKWLEMADRKREHKVVTHCGCLAEMRIKRKDGSGKWYVSRFLDNHNHELVAGKYVDYLRSHRGLSDVEIAHLTSLREVGISIPKIYQSFAAQVGGFNLVRFTKQDMYNEVRKQRSLQNGDVNAAVRYLEGVARVDNRMYWRYTLGQDNNMCDLFWSDGRSQLDYGIFGDVLAFDATYGRNKYNLLVVVFSGVNHHNQTCIFGAAMVSCETQESYIWVLEKFLECMEGKPPNAVITDGDPAMRIAIHEVFPEAHHRLCAWHLLRNATSNICDPRFTHLFRQCMLADLEVHEFEAHWDAMLDECGVREVDWVKDLYRRKHAWATAYIRGRFFAGIRTTSRCESLHAKLGRFVESRYGILEFVTNFQRCIDFLHDNEDELDFRSSYGTPVLQTEFVELEKSGWTKYTRKMFFRYRETLRRCVRVKICHCDVSDSGEVCFGRVACLSDDDFKDYSKKILSDALRLEMKHGLRTAEETVVSVSDVGMKDPIHVRTKGTRRLSQPSATMGKKHHKCRAEPSGGRRCRPPKSVLMDSGNRIVPQADQCALMWVLATMHVVLLNPFYG
ncbi:protein FAR1-RELATED SEQUENCE 5-like [Arachis ipaensis]|uniref:protein FAR1-RELATED SEQUENCE 5-like n=1 Tax=Arachis ipaensis TaxID=130454 RepID=UPI0007AF40A6|nr:protein FAR1-RELATED SEQUENCE 5-like [Arachis ipaensis]